MNEWELFAVFFVCLVFVFFACITCIAVAQACTNYCEQEMMVDEQDEMLATVSDKNGSRRGRPRADE